MILFVCLMPSADRFSFGFLGFLIGPLGLYVSMYYDYFQLFVCYRIPASQSAPAASTALGPRKPTGSGQAKVDCTGGKGVWVVCMEYVWEEGPDLCAISSSRSPRITYFPDLLHLPYSLSFL